MSTVHLSFIAAADSLSLSFDDVQNKVHWSRSKSPGLEVLTVLIPTLHLLFIVLLLFLFTLQLLQCFIQNTQNSNHSSTFLLLSK